MQLQNRRKNYVNSATHLLNTHLINTQPTVKNLGSMQSRKNLKLNNTNKPTSLTFLYIIKFKTTAITKITIISII